MKCPECGRGNIRVAVDLFLDIPMELQHGLSKMALRHAGVKVMGANWPMARQYCDNPNGCRFNTHLAPAPKRPRAKKGKGRR